MRHSVGQPVVIETAVADVDDPSLEREIAGAVNVGIDVPPLVGRSPLSGPSIRTMRAVHGSPRTLN